MSIPPYIQTPYYYVNTAVNDVQDILDDLSVKLQAIGWVEYGPGIYETPVDAWGRYLTMFFTRHSATNLELVILDDGKVWSAAYRIFITGTQTIKYYYGASYVHIVNASDAGPYGEFLWASMLTLAPESETSHNRYCAMYGGRYSDGGSSSTAGLLYASVRFSLGDRYPSIYETQGGIMTIGFVAGVSNAAVGLLTFAGGFRLAPCMIYHTNQNSEYVPFGRLYNRVLCHKDIAIGTRITAQLSEDTSGVFEVINIPSYNWYMKTAMLVQLG